MYASLNDSQSKGALKRMMDVNIGNIQVDFKGLFDLLKNSAAKKDEIRDKVARLHDRFIQLQEHRSELIEENARLKSENEKLKSSNRDRERRVHKDGMYYLPGEDGSVDGPFCTLCWDDADKQIRLRDLDDSWYCPKCEGQVFKANTDHRTGMMSFGDNWMIR